MDSDTIRIAKAIFEGLSAFGRTAAHVLGGGTVAWNDAPKAETEKVEAAQTAPAAPTEAAKPEASKAEPAKAVPPAPAEDDEGGDEEDEGVPEGRGEAPTGLAATIAALNDETPRTRLVEVITTQGIDNTAAFKKAFPDGLGGKRRATLLDFLRGCISKNAATGPPASQQAPPDAPPVAAPEEDAPLALPVTDDGLHDDVRADGELRKKAETMIAGFKELTDKGQGPGVRKFFAKYGCEGNCVDHDRASIERCWAMLQPRK